MATHSSILAWEIPWTEEPARLQSVGCRRVGCDLVTTHTHTHTHTRVLRSSARIQVSFHQVTDLCTGSEMALLEPTFL